MFTGLVQAKAIVVAVTAAPPGQRLSIDSPQLVGVVLGESVAINGCCLTAVASDQGRVDFEAGPETLARTNLGRLQAGSHVNCERSLRVGDSLGGHIVTGHVDGVGELAERVDQDDWSTFWFSCDAELTKLMAAKGSIAVDGVSLTLVDVQPTRFSVALIPHTLAATTLGDLRPGAAVNLENDLVAKYVQRSVSAALERLDGRINSL
jgi:riboflavin synthase